MNFDVAIRSSVVYLAGNMRTTGTAVQLANRNEVATLLVPVVDPENIGGGMDGGVLPLTVYLAADDLAFLEAYAAYRNNLATAAGQKLRSRWSRKSMAEALLATQVKAIRTQLAEMMADLGPLPPKGKTKLEQARAEKYARDAAAWASKRRG